MEKRTMKLKVVFKSGSDAKTIDGPPRNVSVYCKKYGDVEGFSRKAYDHTASNEVKAESSYILGRMYHEMVRSREVFHREKWIREISRKRHGAIRML